MFQIEKASSACAQSKFKFYCQRVPKKQYNNTFMCKKQAIFLQTGINLFKEKVFSLWNGNKIKVNFNNFETKSLYHTRIEEK